MYKKLSIAVVLAFVMTVVSTGSAHAAVTINGNGAWSHNRVKLSERMEKLKQQTNKAYVTNVVETDSDTGKNDANWNTDGDSEVKSGASNTTIDVSTTVNENVDAGSDCGCPDQTDPEVTIEGNGKGSYNKVSIRKYTADILTQSNKAVITNLVSTSSDTGHNDANGNTGGDATVTSGNATTHVTISNTANGNYSSSL